MQTLKDLLAAASPLPWTVEETDSSLWVGIPKDEKLGEIVYGVDLREWRPVHSSRAKANAAFLVRMVNAAPAVLEYMQGGHHRGCFANGPDSIFDDEDFECTCGHDDLVAALNP